MPSPPLRIIPLPLGIRLTRCMCVCIHTYTYICVCIYIYIHVYITLGLYIILMRHPPRYQVTRVPATHGDHSPLLAPMAPALDACLFCLLFLLFLPCAVPSPPYPSVPLRYLGAAGGAGARVHRDCRVHPKLPYPNLPLSGISANPNPPRYQVTRVPATHGDHSPLMAPMAPALDAAAARLYAKSKPTKPFCHWISSVRTYELIDG